MALILQIVLLIISIIAKFLFVWYVAKLIEFYFSVAKDKTIGKIVLVTGVIIVIIDILETIFY